MVKIPENVELALQYFVGKLKQEITVEKAILFGSYSKGTSRKDSDVDLAIFSNYFEGMRRVDGFTFLLLQARDYDVDIEPHPFTLMDYHNQDGMVEEIVRDGIEIPS